MEEDVLSNVIRSEAAARVRSALTRIPTHDREVLLLRHVADLSGPEIAEVLGISTGAVRVRIHRATQRLAQEFGERDATG